MTDRKINKVQLANDGRVEHELIEEMGPVELVSKLLLEKNLNLEDIVSFEACEGPEGSFTGLKIAAATANTLNWALKTGAKPILPKYQTSKYD